LTPTPDNLRPGDGLVACVDDGSGNGGLLCVALLCGQEHQQRRKNQRATAQTEEGGQVSGVQYGAILYGCRCARLGDGVIVFAGTSADANCADDLASPLDRNAPGKDHDFAVIGSVDPEKLLA
jgi:hypothetical protein